MPRPAEIQDPAKLEGAALDRAVGEAAGIEPGWLWGSIYYAPERRGQAKRDRADMVADGGVVSLPLVSGHRPYSTDPAVFYALALVAEEKGLGWARHRERACGGALSSLARK